MYEGVVGAALIAAAFTLLPPTTGGTLVFALPSGGTVVLLGGIAIMGELVVAGAGAVSVVHSGWVLSQIHGNPVSKNYKFPSAQELAERLGVNETTFHRTIKPDILHDPEIAQSAKKIGSTNPDIGIDGVGNIVLRNPQTGKIISTNVPLDAFSILK